MKEITESSPLMTALKNQDWQTARMLIEASAEVNIRNKAGGNSLDFIARAPADQF